MCRFSYQKARLKKTAWSRRCRRLRQRVVALHELQWVSELAAERIRSHADRPHVAHLAQSVEALVAPAESTQMGYFDFLDLVLEQEGRREGGAAVPQCLEALRCRSTRASTGGKPA
jgi:hypothetical protein